MGKRAANIRRLSALPTSGQTLVETIQRLKDNPGVLDETVTRGSIRWSYERLWRDVGHTLSLPVEDDEDFDWDIANFLRLLRRCLDTSAALRDAFAQAWERHPCTEDEP